jgi:hypothetical protein
MNSLPETIPDEDFLLALETEELAGYVLKFGKRQSHNGLLHLNNFQNSLFVQNIGGHKYGQKRQAEITLAVAEAWSWLEVQGFLVTAPGMNGASGFRVLSRRALKFGDQDDLRSFANPVPKSARTQPVMHALGEGNLRPLASLKTAGAAYHYSGG